jgi:PII-like signaling protein
VSEAAVSEPGIKLTTYFGEREREGGRFLADALFDVYERHQMHTSVLLRGVEGFGHRHQLQTDRLLTLSESLPAVSVAIDTHERVEQALPEVLRTATHGLISLERATLLSAESLTAAPIDSAGPAEGLKLTLYGGRSVRRDGQAGYVAAIDALRSCGAAGASALLAVDGTLHGQRRRARFFARNADVPLMLLSIGDAASLNRALPALAGLLTDMVATVERVQICKSGGTRFSEPHGVPESDDSGLPILQKLMVHVEEQAKHHGHPVHVALVRRLREAGAAGVTVLRGVRGFYGDRAPFADRLLSLRRNVPVHVVMIDTPASIRSWWPIVDEVTREGGLVTSELVPAAHAVEHERRAPQFRLARTPAISHRRH